MRTPLPRAGAPPCTDSRTPHSPEWPPQGQPKYGCALPEPRGKGPAHSLRHPAFDRLSSLPTG